MHGDKFKDHHSTGSSIQTTVVSVITSLSSYSLLFQPPSIVELISSHLSSHLALIREDRWGTTDDFTTSFLHFSMFPTALWDSAKSRPVQSLMLSSNSPSVCLVSFPLSLCFARLFWPDLMNERLDHTTAVCLSLR